VILMECRCEFEAAALLDPRRARFRHSCSTKDTQDGFSQDAESDYRAHFCDSGTGMLDLASYLSLDYSLPSLTLFCSSHVIAGCSGSSGGSGSVAPPKAAAPMVASAHRPRYRRAGPACKAARSQELRRMEKIRSPNAGRAYTHANSPVGPRRYL
jgi:hypothetical protein